MREHNFRSDLEKIDHTFLFPPIFLSRIPYRTICIRTVHHRVCTNSVGRVCIPCTEALSSLQPPRLQVRPLALCCVSPPTLSLCLLSSQSCPINKAIKGQKNTPQKRTVHYGKIHLALSQWFPLINVNLIMICQDLRRAFYLKMITTYYD